MQKVARCQPFKLISFTMPLRQDAFCQELHKRFSLIFANEDNIAFFPVCCKLIGLTLGLDFVRVLTHAWPIETYPLESTVKADLSTEPIGSVMYFPKLSLGLLLPHTSRQNSSRRFAVQFSLYQGEVFQCLQFCHIFFFNQSLFCGNSPIVFTSFFLESLLQHFNNRLLPFVDFYPGAAFFKCYL